MKRLTILATFFMSAMLVFGSNAVVAADLQVGRDYTVIDPPLPSASPGKIEVVEFFSYGCSHCYEFHPLIVAWTAKLPKDVVLRRVPVTLSRPPWMRLAGIYYGLDATGNIDKLDGEVFKAIHVDRVNFDSNEAVANWVNSKGADGKKVVDAMNSFGVQTRLKQVDPESARYGIAGTPALAVNGRYLVNTAGKNYGDLLVITDALITKVRSEKPTK